MWQLATFIFILSSNYAVSKPCQTQANGFFSALKRGETWALILRDSWGSRPSGISYGNLVDYGNFDQCYNYAHAHPSLGAIDGQYCLVQVQETDTKVVEVPPYRIAVCVPATCRATEIDNILRGYLIEEGLKVTDSNIFCEKKISPDWSPLEWFGLIFFILSLIIVGISTALGVLQRRRHHQEQLKSDESKKVIKVNHLISAFSLQSNLSSVLRCGEVSTSTQSLDCLHGVRGISVLWIIYQHTYYMQLLAFPLINDNYKYQWSEHLFGMTYKSAGVVVDHFLFMSGLLVTWNFLHERQKGKPLNLMKMYANRYIRLTTALAPIILYTVTFLRFSGSGPEWTIRTNQIIGFCDKYWWSALLHIQNYVNPAEVCVGQSWYLSVDMQLFILSPLILIPIWKWGGRVLWIVAAIIGLILIYIFVIVIYKDVHVSIFLRDTLDRVVYVYMPTHIRAIPWLIGIIVGYYLFRSKGKPMPINKVTYIFLWLLSIILMIAVIFSPYEAHKPNIKVGRLTTAAHTSLSNFSWILATSWIVIACCKHTNSIANKFLSHSLWLPLSRLSFSVYLVHLHLQYMMIASTKTTIHFTDVETLHTFFGDVGFALIIGLLWYLFYEIPFCHLAKRYLRDVKTKPSAVTIEPSQVVVVPS